MGAASQKAKSSEAFDDERPLGDAKGDLDLWLEIKPGPSRKTSTRDV